MRHSFVILYGTNAMSFKVTLLPSGREFSVESGETVLNAAIRKGIGLPYGCRSGRCGSCIAVLAQGEVDSPDGPPEALAHEPEDRCLPCMAYPQSDLVLEVREVETPDRGEVHMLPARVQGIDHLTHDVVRLWLKLPDTQRLQFRAGQYIDFVLADGSHRAFSIANAPGDDALIELHIRHIDGGRFTDWVFSKLEDQTILRIEGPHGSFVLDEASPRPMLFIGGGTGLAPIKSQIEHALHKGIERPMTLYWGVRSQRDLYLPELPEQWAREHANFQYVPILSEPDADWTGRTGFVHEAVLADIDDPVACDFYMAGPPVMVKAALDALHSAGVPDAQIHYDSFEYATTKDKQAARQEPGMYGFRQPD